MPSLILLLFMLFQVVTGTGLNRHLFAGLGHASCWHGNDARRSQPSTCLLPICLFVLWVKASQGCYANRLVIGVALPSGLCSIRRPLLSLALPLYLSMLLGVGDGVLTTPIACVFAEERGFDPLFDIFFWFQASLSTKLATPISYLLF